MDSFSNFQFVSYGMVIVNYDIVDFYILILISSPPY